MDEEAREYEARALTAEDELTGLRLCLREYRDWLSSPIRGRVIYRREVAERLSAILVP